MSTASFRPKYVSFDCYGTLISWPIDAAAKKVARRPLGKMAKMHPLVLNQTRGMD